ncbi:MAG: hypothetical protein HQK65_21310 [Desulfamplus sp.]|nr:hypothetical protein [Desulfamplus sp.]
MNFAEQQLVQKGLISQEQLKEATDYQKSIGGDISKILQKLGYLSEEDFAKFLAEEYNHPYIPYDKVKIDEKLIVKYPEPFMQQKFLFPLKRTESVLSLAMANPTDLETIDKLSFETGCTIEISMVTERTVERVLRLVFHNKNEERETERQDDEANEVDAPKETDEAVGKGKVTLNQGIKKVIEGVSGGELLHTLLKVLLEREIISLNDIQEELRK